MWQRFTERARKVVFYAQEEAQKFGEGYVSTEHLLLGLVREPDSAAGQVLERMGVSLSRVNAEVEKLLPRGEARVNQDMTLTPRAKRVIDLAFDEARSIGNNYIGTEHLLLGLTREGDGMAGRVLAKLNVELEPTRRFVISLQAEQGPRRDGQHGPTPDDLARVSMNALALKLSRYWPDLTRVAQDCLFASCQSAAEQQSAVWPAHLFLAVASRETMAKRILSTIVDEPHLISDSIAAHLKGARDKGSAGGVSEEVVLIVSEAAKIAEEAHQEHTGTEHLLIAMVELDADGFAQFGLTSDAVLKALRSP